MKKQKDTKPCQVPDLLRKVRACIQFDRWTLSIHAIDRKNERMVGIEDIVYVLKNGFHEKNKTIYDEYHKSWKYAIRGITVDSDELRIIVAFLPDDMLVITVIRLGCKK